jgi:apolipoprotein N-acyltransferase
MGKLTLSPHIKQSIYKALVTVNDRAFSLITVFAISACITMLDAAFSISDRMNTLGYAFVALAVLVISTTLSSTCKGSRWLRLFSATICVFLWLFVAQLGGVFTSGVAIYSAVFYAVLFWSKINLLGVFLNARK